MTTMTMTTTAEHGQQTEKEKLIRELRRALGLVEGLSSPMEGAAGSSTTSSPNSRRKTKQQENCTDENDNDCRLALPFVSPLAILEAVDHFLMSWDKLEEDNEEEDDVDEDETKKNDGGLPVDLLRHVLCQCLQGLGPGNKAFRKFILTSLVNHNRRSIISCRSVLLSFLPAILPLSHLDNSNPPVMDEGRTDRSKRGGQGQRRGGATINNIRAVKKEISQVLREILEDDERSLSVILDTLSLLLASSSAGVFEADDVVHFLVEILPKVPEEDLGAAIQFLMNQVGEQSIIDDEDKKGHTSEVPKDRSLANTAVAAIRTELVLLDKSGDLSGMSSVVTNLGQCDTTHLRKDQKSFFVETYLDAIQELIDRAGESEALGDVDVGICTVDMAVVVLHLNGSTYSQKAGLIVDSIFSSSACSKSVPSASKLMELVSETRDGDDDKRKDLYSDDDNDDGNFISSTLQQALLHMSVFVFLAPLRQQKYYKEFTTRQFVLDVIFSLEAPYRQKLANMLVQLILDQSRQFCTKGEESIINTNLVRTWSCVYRDVLETLAVAVEEKQAAEWNIHAPMLKLLQSNECDNHLGMDTIEQLCTVIAKLSNEDSSRFFLDSFLAFRTLLFSPVRCGGAEDDKSRRRRIIRGLLLGKAMIVDSRMGFTSLSSFCRLLSKVLLHPSGQMVDSSIGLYGLRILSTLYENDGKNSSLEDVGPFPVTTRMLTNSRVVQYTDSKTRKSIPTHPVVLGYSEVPKFLLRISDKKDRQRSKKMIFRFEEFFRIEKACLTRSSSWEDSCRWIFGLIDSYLTMARTPKWNPSTWVWGSLELYTVSTPTTSVLFKRNVQFMQQQFCSISNLEGDDPAPLNAHIVDVLKSVRKSSERNDVLESVYRLALSLLLSEFLSAAILKHVHDHFSCLFGDQDAQVRKPLGKRNEAVLLMQHQLLKMYDMKVKLRSIERFYRLAAKKAIGTAAKRGRHQGRKRRTPKSEVQIEMELAANQIRQQISILFHSDLYVPTEVIWLSLTETPNNADFVSLLNVESLEGADAETLQSIVAMRLELLRHLASLDEKSLSSSCKSLDRSVLRRRASQCAIDATYLIQRIPVSRRNLEDQLPARLSRLAAAYFRLLRKILVTMMDSLSDLRFLHGLYLGIMGSDISFNDTTQTKLSGKSLGEENFKDLVASFRVLLGSSDGAIVTELLETLCIFAYACGSWALTMMIDVSWDQLLSHARSLTPNENLDEGPFSFAMAIKQRAPNAVHLSSGSNIVDHILRDRLLKLTPKRYKLGEKHLFMINALCLHWGLLALSPQNTTKLTEHTGRLATNINDYLNEALGPGVAESGSSNSRLVPSRRHEGTDACDEDEDDEYTPPPAKGAKRKAKFADMEDFPMLSSASFPIFLDVLLRMIVANVCLFSFEEQSACVSSVHPVQQLEELLQQFASLSRLYTKYSPYFPKMVIPSLLKTQKCMLNVCSRKVQEFQVWRNNQPVVTADIVAEGVEDPASVFYLKELILIFGNNVVVPLQSSNIYALQGPVGRFRVFLEKTTKVYGLDKVEMDPQDTLVEMDKDTAAPSSKRRRIDRESPERLRTGEGLMASSLAGNEDEDDDFVPDFNDEEDEDDDDSSSGSAFGASGDWGQDEESDEEDPSSLRELTVTS